MIASIPSPDQGVWMLGPFPVRAYALCILAGIIVAVVWSQRRLEARGGSPGQVLDIAVWAVPFGIVGGRIYHVISSPQAYFGEGGHPIDALKIWQGGLGIWGAVALGAVGGWIGCRRTGVSFRTLGDALAPPLAVAQAIGRLGNWFNNELYGRPTTQPWGLEIHQWDHARGRALVDAAGNPIILGTFEPTFLYEAVWCVLIAVVMVVAGRRLAPWRGQLMAVYLMLYTLGRVVIENLRIDEANHILGLRLNVWTSIVVFVFGAALWWHLRRGERIGDTATIQSTTATDASADPEPHR